MRIQLLIPVLFFSIGLRAQTRQFHVETEKDSMVKVYNGKDLIANYIVNPTVKSKIMLTGYLQQKDPAGKYIVTYMFSSTDNSSLINVHFVAKFNAPVFDAKYWSGARIGNPGEVLNSEKTEYRLTVDRLQTNTFTLLVVGKENVITTFSGIDSVSQ
jgi:hypothetical protein